MADKMDRGLDDIIAETRSSAPRPRRGGGDRRRGDRQDYSSYPRDGVRKAARNEPRDIDSEWVHDRFFDQDNARRAPAGPRRQRESPAHTESRGYKLRVDNIHYDLTEEDLDELFTRIGPVTRLELLYDRAGRSEGVAYVTYEYRDDAQDAIRQFDGANANGQPIRLTLMPGASSRNPFDTAVMPSRPLAERISAPSGRSRSLSPRRRQDEDDAARKGIDRYIPGSGSRSRSPMRRRRGGAGGGGGGGGGRRPGFRRGDDGARDQQGQGARGGWNNTRTRKTQEELDAEMEDYFGGNNASAPAAAEPRPANGTAAAAGNDDIDMIE